MAKRETPICPIHGTPMTYLRKFRKHFCQECTYASFLTQQTQREAQKRYQGTDKGRAAEKRYEDKNPDARAKYLKGDKYKAARKAYNNRLKESLRIARMALAEKTSKEKPVEALRTQALSPLMQDIREYIDVMGRKPSTAEVMEWSSEIFKVRISAERARELIDSAKE